jgi:hypothetical protein
MGQRHIADRQGGSGRAEDVAGVKQVGKNLTARGARLRLVIQDTN